MHTAVVGNLVTNATAECANEANMIWFAKCAKIDRWQSAFWIIQYTAGDLMFRNEKCRCERRIQLSHSADRTI